MKEICIEMSQVSECSVTECIYNTKKSCHAKAITIGDSVNPGCDTYLAGSKHVQKSAQLQAGIGACKTSTCKFNDDFECNADSIRVGMVSSGVNCMTFTMR